MVKDDHNSFNSSQVRWRGEQDDSALDDLKTLFDCGVDFMEHGQAADATGSLEEYVDGMYNLVQPPLEILVRAEDKLRTCYNNMGTVIFQVVIKSLSFIHWCKDK